MGLALGWLSPDEVAKVERYKSQSSRHNALQVRLALRAILSRHSDVAPAQWQFTYGAKGKPALSDELFASTGLHFNLSHSGKWLMIGVIEASQYSISDAPALTSGMFFGVDIERERSSTDIVPILHHYFTQAETDTLLQLPIELQRQRFFDLWAVKESYIKARGLGLALSLKSFSVDFSQAVCCDAKLKRANKSTRLIEMFKPIQLNFTDNQDTMASDYYWQTLLGRLDNEYRFSITLGSANLVFSSAAVQAHSIYNTLSCMQLTLDDLFSART
ncbi:4'-phosphopantetheinyl transferase superfamily protein [Shewanella inventionis]|nr:4'-phosphopantetheinyl transferase superfamily protein [Shewanella inventionis]